MLAAAAHEDAVRIRQSFQTLGKFGLDRLQVVNTIPVPVFDNLLNPLRFPLNRVHPAPIQKPGRLDPHRSAAGAEIPQHQIGAVQFEFGKGHGPDFRFGDQTALVKEGVVGHPGIEGKGIRPAGRRSVQHHEVGLAERQIPHRPDIFEGADLLLPGPQALEYPQGKAGNAMFPHKSGQPRRRPFRIGQYSDFVMAPQRTEEFRRFKTAMDAEDLRILPGHFDPGEGRGD